MQTIQAKLTALSPLTGIFADPRPCPLCRRPGPTYPDRETGARYCLHCLEAAVEAMEAEMGLTGDADVYAVLLAFDKALGAAPGDYAALPRYAARYPQFTEDLITVAFARFAFGWGLDDPLEDSPEDAETVAFGRATLDELLPAIRTHADKTHADKTHAEMLAEEVKTERQEMARLACWDHRIAA